MIKWEIPLKTVSEANSSEYWRVKRKRHEEQQFIIRSLFLKEHAPIVLPCTITLSRLSPRLLDCEENLPMAFKWIKDEIGACIFPEKVIVYRNKKGKLVKNKGHADSDPRITWQYDQKKQQQQGIRIEIEF